MTVVDCPTCGERLAIELGSVDGSIDCTKCGQSVTIGERDAAKAETLDAPAFVDQTHTLAFSSNDPDPRAVPGLVAVGGYEVLGEIGRGGMGVVYKARQLNPPRLVALKMILAGEHADPEQLARFRVEAGAIARLTHPAIAQIHQVGEWHPPEGGPTVPFLTLEYIDGPTLAERLRSETPTLRQAVGLVRRLAEAAQAAHDKGIVHRDLKPANVLLVGPTGEHSFGDPKIIDFGLAKPLDGFATVADGGAQTNTGTILGTPSYMAPEQAAGSPDIGPAADVYTLGAILYELLTGRPPFLAETTLDTLLQVTQDDPVPPRQVRSTIPRDLETVCLTCLAKDPRQRYPSAMALAEDLDRYLAGESVRVRPRRIGTRTVRWVRRQKSLAYLAGGAALALLIVLVFSLFRYGSSNQSKSPLRDTTPVAETTPLPPSPTGENPITEARRRVTSSNNLKQILLALHNINDVKGSLPPPAITDASGKPLLSWRVAILPYIEQDDLYKQFKVDEPWDSENNKKLISSMPSTFAINGQTPREPGMTHYQAIVGPGAGWEANGQLEGPFGRKGITLISFTDGTSNTILVAEVAEPVIWTKPADATLGPTGVPVFGGVVQVRFIRSTAKPDQLRFALTRASGEVLDEDWNDPSERKTFQSVEEAVRPSPPMGTGKK